MILEEKTKKEVYFDNEQECRDMAHRFMLMRYDEVIVRGKDDVWVVRAEKTE